MKRPVYILPLIVVSQFAGTSLWFAVNAVLPEIIQNQNLSDLGNITAIIQLGFIVGTLVFAILSVADRFSSSKIFFISSLLAAAANFCVIWVSKNIEAIYVLRFITGFFLAGIYPVGMKIAADWYDQGLGKALGFLVGALVLGTAFPNLLKLRVFQLEWDQILVFTSAFALLGGVLILLFVGDGPYKKVSRHFQPSATFKIFQSADFRSAAIGYFGHMWELYTFWSFVPLILLSYYTHHQLNSNAYGWAFIIIAIGSIGCAMGGYFSQKMGSARVAFYSLMVSGLCCFLSVFINQFPPSVFYLFMLVWGISVIADSPQLSTLVAQMAPTANKGTALTIVTSIGFAITILSIQFVTFLFADWENKQIIFLTLVPGPIIGLISLRRLMKRRSDQ
ncbi:MAG: nitrate/nitrite transporter [Cyclobacteriaceae bacterium]